MKRFIVVFSKVLPWINLVLGFLYVVLDPPRNDYGGYERGLAVFILIGVILTTLLLIAFSYVVEAACKYLKE